MPSDEDDAAKLAEAERLSRAAVRRIPARPFLPTVDLLTASAGELGELDAQDRELLLATKVADATHFYVGLTTLHRHVATALELAADVRPLPATVRGQLVGPGGDPAARVGVQANAPGGGPLGRGVLTDELGVFTLPLPPVADSVRAALVAQGLPLRIRGANGSETVVVPVPATGSSALGAITLTAALEPLPRSVVGALMDLVDGLPGSTPGDERGHVGRPPLRVELGQDACNIVFEEDAVLRRFPYRLLVRLVEPRITTVTRVFFRPEFAVPFAFVGEAARSALSLSQSRFVERLPIDKPVSVDGFRDQLIGLRNGRIGDERLVPMAGTLGLGYVLNLAQVWKYDGLTLGNLVYSLPLAPGEQQRIAVSERVATASVTETEVVDVAERQHASVREDASTDAVFTSAFEEHVRAGSNYSNQARSSSWGVAGGIGFALGPIAIGVGAGGGGGSSSNSGSTRSSLDGARTYTSRAAEDMHRSVESEASARRRSQRTAIRLATETDRETVTTKVITNHNKAHALTMQYWEVLRRFTSTTEVEGVTLVCFVPLDLVRFLPPGQDLELTGTTGVDTRGELLTRYSLLHRHADAIQPHLPGRHREGLRLLEDLAANPRAGVAVDGPATDTLSVSLAGTFIPYERLWVNVLLRGGRRLGPVPMDSPLTDIAAKVFGTEAELKAELVSRRNATGAPVVMTGSLAIPETVDQSEIVGFEIARRFRPVDYQLDPTKNPSYQALKALTGVLPGIDLTIFDADVRLDPGRLEQLLGGPLVKDFSVKVNGAGPSIAADNLATRVELPPSPLPVAALERNPQLRFRDLLKIERTLQHVVRNTLTYSKAIWSSLTAEERVVILEGYTIGLPEGGLGPDGLTDASQHVPLLNCVANQVLGYYGNCLILPFSIPAALAVALAGDDEEEEGGGEGGDREPLTTGAVQEALTRFHREAFSPPVSSFTLPTRGVLGEAVLGHCTSAEKIDLTRFWNWQDSPADTAPEITGVGLRSSSVANLAAPATLSGAPSIINIAPGQGGSAGLGTLAAALAAEGGKQADFSTDFLGLDVLKTLGGKTIETAESARADALGKATQLAGDAMKAATDVYKTGQASKDAKEARKETADKAAAEKAAEKLVAAAKDLKDNADAYLGVAGSKPNAAAAEAFARAVVDELAGGPLPANVASKLFAAFDKSESGTRTQASTAWLTALGLI